MLEQRRIKLFCEGPHDHSFLETLAELGRLPAAVELPKRGTSKGKDAIPPAVAANLRAGISSIAVRDYDELRRDEVARWLARAIGHSGAAITPLADASDAYVIATPKPIVVIGVGHLPPPPAEVASVTRGTIDEYLFRLLLDRDVYEAASEINECSYDVWRKKLVEVRSMIESNGLPAPTLKQLVRLPHLLTSFEGAPTTLTQKAVHAAAVVGKLDGLCEPLRTGVAKAGEALLRA